MNSLSEEFKRQFASPETTHLSADQILQLACSKVCNGDEFDARMLKSCVDAFRKKPLTDSTAWDILRAITEAKV